MFRVHSSTTDQRDHFNLVALADDGLGMLMFGNDVQIQLDSHQFGPDTDRLKQFGDRCSSRNRLRLAINDNGDDIGWVG